MRRKGLANFVEIQYIFDADMELPQVPFAEPDEPQSRQALLFLFCC
jgi:hypothetical protein